MSTTLFLVLLAVLVMPDLDCCAMRPEWVAVVQIMLTEIIVMKLSNVRPTHRMVADFAIVAAVVAGKCWHHAAALAIVGQYKYLYKTFHQPRPELYKIERVLQTCARIQNFDHSQTHRCERVQHQLVY